MTSFIPPEGAPTNSHDHHKSNEKSPTGKAIPNVLFGVDWTEIEQVIMNQWIESNPLQISDDKKKEIDTLINEAGKKSVKPRQPKQNR